MARCPEEKGEAKEKAWTPQLIKVHRELDYFEGPMATDSLLKKLFVRDERMIFRKIGDEFILVPNFHERGDVGSIYSMSHVAAYVWEVLDGRSTVEEIRDKIIEEWEVTSQTAESDLVEFLNQLVGIGAIKEVRNGMSSSPDCQDL